MDFSVRSWEGSDEHDDSDQGGHDEDNRDFENNEDDADDNVHEHQMLSGREACLW